MFKAMAQCLKELIFIFFLAIFSKAAEGLKPYSRATVAPDAVNNNYCLSWRLAAEANNLRGWRTVPVQCMHYIEAYMTGGQYERDLDFITEQILSYVSEVVLSGDGMDAWILDVDDTCISNIFYYKKKRYGRPTSCKPTFRWAGVDADKQLKRCEPYDPAGFKAWALKGRCPAIPAVLGLFQVLIESGFKVFLVTGRDQETLAQSTISNLHNQGFIGYDRLILRTASYEGQSAVAYKSDIRKQLVGEGYRIWGNVGDQWSDLQGEFSGNRTFKLPNPMYFVP